MSKVITNKAIARYDGNEVESNSTVTLIDDLLQIYKSAINYVSVSDHPTINNTKVYEYYNGTNIYYEIVISNSNIQSATDITITDLLNKGLTYSENSAKLFIDGIESIAPIVNRTPETDTSGEILLFNIIDLPSNTSAILFFSVNQVTSNNLAVDTTAVNSVSINYKYTIDNLVRVEKSNNVYVKYIKNPAKLSIEKHAPENVLCNEHFYYTIIIQNEGESNASGIVINDILPETFNPILPIENAISIKNDNLAISSSNYTVTIDKNKNIEINIPNTIILLPNKVIEIKIEGYVPCN